MFYFAYGSNLYSRRLLARTPNARLAGTARLEAHSLRFHKRGDDGSGKCDAFFTGHGSDVIHGVLYHFDPRERAILDAVEGDGYQPTAITAHQGSQAISAFTYIVRSEMIDAAMVPFTWYRNFVLAGALEHRLPQAYVQSLRQVPHVADPDGERHDRNHSILDQGMMNLLDG